MNVLRRVQAGGEIAVKKENMEWCIVPTGPDEAESPLF